MSIVPENYFSNLSCYEELVLRCGILGLESNNVEVLNSLPGSANYRWFHTGDEFVFIDMNGNKLKPIIAEDD